MDGGGLWAQPAPVRLNEVFLLFLLFLLFGGCTSADVLLSPGSWSEPAALHGLALWAVCLIVRDEEHAGL